MDDTKPESTTEIGGGGGGSSSPPETAMGSGSSKSPPEEKMTMSQTKVSSRRPTGVEPNDKNSFLFTFMTRHPLPFLTIIPIILIVLTILGWTRDDVVESDVGDIWIRTGGSYAKDKAYAESLLPEGTQGRASATTFAAMAISRDGENLFTEDRLMEVRARMEKAETETKVEYKGNTYTWPDLCSKNDAGKPATTYRFPCVRLSPMDLFQEAQWFFEKDFKVTWYNSFLKERLVKVRLPRFGILTNVCTNLTGSALSQGTFCNHQYQLRTDEEYAISEGYPKEYARPLSLFSDIGNLEMNDPCKMCIETGFESTMESLTTNVKQSFELMAFELNRLYEANTTNSLRAAQMLQTEILPILNNVNRESVQEFYFYYVGRGLYSELGWVEYQKSYAKFMNLTGTTCKFLELTGADLNGCPMTVTEAEARKALLDHADNTFSNVTTSGIPIPYWGPNSGAMFGGTSPVGGSGINMGGTLFSMAAYFDAANVRNFTAWNPKYENGKFGYLNAWDDIADPNWDLFVESDPVYRWFQGGITPMLSSCANGDIPGTSLPPLPFGPEFPDPDNPGSTLPPLNLLTAASMKNQTQYWCTEYNTPNADVGAEIKTQQHFAKMWYDLLVDSPQFLNSVQGESDPYTWTTGQGCGYTLAGERHPFTDKDESDILFNASMELYYIDEGESVGVLDRNVLIGDVTPAVGQYNTKNPLTHVGVIQSIYPALIPVDIVERVKNCNRPGGPVMDLTIEDAEEILEEFKETFEEKWSEGWDDEDDGSEVQFVGFFDEVGVQGTTGRMLQDITLSGGTLTAISCVIIAVFSVLFLLSTDVIKSRILITLIGTVLVILSFFAALGLGILIGIKINITIGWTLPFIIIGLGVDDMYIISLALKRRGGYTEHDFVGAMKDILAPVSMTSLVNACMFAVMNITDIPAIYKTAQAALLSVVFLYLTIIFCFPAYCWLDMKRQRAGRMDVLFCLKSKKRKQEEAAMSSSVVESVDDGDVAVMKKSSKAERDDNDTSGIIYHKFYKPLFLGDGTCQKITHLIIYLGTAALLGVSIWGITEREVGLGLEDFFPEDNPASVWATTRTESLATWSVTMNWGELDYTNPQTQMGMIKQFEDVIATPYIAEVSTDLLWIAKFNVWTTKHCTANFDRDSVYQKECGSDFVYPEDNTTCTGTWMLNTMGLREKTFVEEPCQPSDIGVCRPTSQMHIMDIMELQIDTTKQQSWCPVFDNWSTDKLAFCLRNWQNYTGGGGNLLVEEGTPTATPVEQCPGETYKDDKLQTPVKLSQGPSMFSFGLTSHQLTVDMIEQTRAICDDSEDYHCWMSGIPFDYWEQYIYVDELLYQLVGASVVVGFGVASIFLFLQMSLERKHGRCKVLAGSLAGGFIIATITLLSVVVVYGLSTLADVSLTAFSDMSYVLSVGFAVEYSVHVVHRFITAPMDLLSASDRVEYAMSILFLPTLMSFISSTIGVACLAFTDFKFNTVYFFRPLIIVMFVTYFFGCYFLPVFLRIMNFSWLKLGHGTTTDEEGIMGVEVDEEDILEKGTPEDQTSRDDDGVLLAAEKGVPVMVQPEDGGEEGEFNDEEEHEA